MSIPNPITDEIFRRAKCAALGQKRCRLTMLDILHALRELSRSSPLGEDLRAAFARDAAEIRWPKEVDELAASALQATSSEVERSRLPLEESLAEVVRNLHRQDPTLPSRPFLEAVLGLSDPVVVELRELNGLGPGKAEPPALRRLEEATAAAAQLREALARRVLGQDAAVKMLCQAYFRARLCPPDRGPRGIFTFLGPSGVGKTLLAESFAVELGEIDGRAMPFRRFDMASFGGHQNFEQLFGAEQFYKGSRPGTLTGFVHENPRAVVLFDEIEKSHENVIRSLLAVLDKGVATDKALDKPVDFRDVWIVLTTNLGRELFDSEYDSGVLRNAALSSSAVFDLLATARGRLEVGMRDAPPALPPEFVSRLAQGGAVVFNRLEIGHYLRLVEMHCKVADGDGEGPTVSADEDARLLFLMTLLPDLDARRVVASSRAWAADLVAEGWDERGAELRSSGAESLHVRIRCSGEATAFLDGQLREGGPLRVIFVDDDSHLAEAVRAGCADLPITIERIERGEDAARRLARAQTHAVFLDLSIGEDPASPIVERALETLESVRRHFPDLPVLLFSENPQNRNSFDDVVSRVLRAGGARGYLPCRRDPDNAILQDDFVGRAREAIKEVVRGEILRRNARARQRVSFRTRFLADGGRLVAELLGVTEEVVVSAQDQAASIRFAGIPRERFEDVAGLDRAKRRLRQVAGWLRQPEALTAFGISPPKGFLLAGPPGTGKTLLARAFAGESGLPFLALSAGELQSKWHGESEERVRDLFDRARRYAPSIVFIDEIDAVGARAEGPATAPVHGSILNQILSCMDGFRSVDRPVFILAATNRPDHLDPALKRPGRFDEVIPIDLPDAKARTEFFARRLAALPIEPGVDQQSLVRATVGCAPAVLDRIVREAVYRAASEGRERLEARDLEEASRLVRFGAARQGEAPRPEDARLTAWHEAGHAVAHLTLFPESRIEHVTIMPSESGALGFTAPEQDEQKRDVTVEDVRRRIAVLLAGREAERILVESDAAASAGASSDLLRATQLARTAIGRWGFDGAFGAVVVDALDEAERSALAGRLEERLRAWLEEGHVLARATLDASRDALESVAEKLEEHESLGGEELERIVRGKQAAKEI